MESQSEVVFLGTGTSEGVPRVSCLTAPVDACGPPPCLTCRDSVRPGSKNRRRNCSILIRKRLVPGDERFRNVIVDVGKFFFESAIVHFPALGDARYLDAVVLTHAHADHILGLDDLRDWTMNIRDQSIESGCKTSDSNARGIMLQPKPLPIFLDLGTLDRVRAVFPYLLDRKIAASAVASLSFFTIDDGCPFEPVEFLRLTPLRVEHGSTTALGFRFGDVSYIPDVSRVPPETIEKLAGTRLLIIDALWPEGSHPSHFTMPDAMKLAELLKPERVVFVDMTHSWGLHDDENQRLREIDTPFTVELAFDGKRIDTSRLGV
mmetsp:Transcript_5638/g.11878  ORF Transcript_5638/g.11878 Transcript_5638/m.11878 type:complete len:320 (-) Transcript_5638:1567-2526(-)